jgi:hypothetical protein
MKRTLPTLAVILALGAVATPLAAAAATVSAAPVVTGYGQNVNVDLSDTPWPLYVRATRYSRSGSSFTIEYEYVQDGFGPINPDFGYPLVDLGELAPGNYSVTAHLIDIDNPHAAPQVAQASVPVAPPSDYGVYPVPSAPRANDTVQILVRSAAFFDPRTLRATVTGNSIRVDFQYHATAPGATDGPAGMTTFASVQVGRLAPGGYHVEGWAAPDTGGASAQYFTRDFAVDRTATVVEYYQEDLDHYFMSASPDEIDLLDGGGQGGWKRTAQGFHAWLARADAPGNAQPVCRFYAAGPNSHFYTGDASECASLKALEQQQRADAAAHGQRFLGWGYEGIAFYALVPVNGKCPSGTSPVWRAYNNRAGVDDSNHRFTVDPAQRAAMAASWIEEGAVFCSAP